MAIINFPDTTGQPTDGSFTYTFEGVLYSWTGTYWAANTQSGFDSRYVEVAGDTMTGDLTVPSLNGGPLAGFRNQLINGDFRVWQRGTTKNFTGVAPDQLSDFYIADRWNVSFNSSAGVNATASRTSFATTDIPGAVWGFNFAQPGAIGIGISQLIETEPSTNGVFTNGSSWTLSWWTDNANVQAQVQWGDATAPVLNATTRQTLETIGSFTRYSTTVTISSNARVGDLGLRVVLYDPGAAPASFSVTQIQLEPGPVATPFEHRPIGTELALCQRYYATSGVRQDAFIFDAGNNTAALTRLFPVQMRTTPTVDITTSGWSNPGIQVQGADGMWIQGRSSGFPKLDSYTADAEL